jgi:hypothetical protein
MSEWRDGYQALGTKPRERDNVLGDLFLLFLKLLKWTVIVCGAAFAVIASGLRCCCSIRWRGRGARASPSRQGHHGRRGAVLWIRMDEAR